MTAYKTEVYIDQFGPDETDDPRQWDNVFGLVFSLNGYSLANEADINFDEYQSWDEVAEAIKELHPGAQVLPVYANTKGGIALSIDRSGPFACQWDSGQIGLAYHTAEQAAEWHTDGGAFSHVADDQSRLDVLRAELAEYQSYLNGEVYVVEVIDTETEELIELGRELGEERAEEAAEALLEVYNR